MTDTQEGDVLLFQTNDGGNVNIVGGITEMTGGLETAAYLSLFGGNDEDDGSDNNPKSWWGNIDITNPSFRYVSRTQHLLRNIPATSGNLRRVEQAAEKDLKWFKDDKIANEITVIATIPTVNKIKLVVSIFAIGQEAKFEFTENWRAMQ